MTEKRRIVKNVADNERENNDEKVGSMKQKKSKYVAITLAATIALSTVVMETAITTPQQVTTAEAATHTKAKAVRSKIRALKWEHITYQADVSAAKAAFDALTTAEQKYVSNAKQLAAHVKVANATALLQATNALPTAAQINAIQTYTMTGNVVDMVSTTDKKGKITVRGVNKTLEEAAQTLANFQTEYKKVATTVQARQILAKQYRTYNVLVKKVKAQQNVVNAQYYAKNFIDLYDVLHNGGTVAIEATTISSRNGRFKIDSDVYDAKKVNGVFSVTDSSGENVPLTNDTFTIENKDTDSSPATLFNTYKLTLEQGKIVVTKIEETATIPQTTGYGLSTKMTVANYAKLVAGTTKYSDAQIEVIQKMKTVYNRLSAAAKRTVTAEQKAFYNKITKEAAAQQTLETKLVSSNVSGVSKELTKLRYKNDLDAYEKEISDARTHYDALLPKYKKKVKASTVKTLKNHEAAIAIMKKIDALDVSSLAKNSDDTTTKALITSINGLEADYQKADRAVKTLVKNYRMFKANRQLTTTQTNYFESKPVVDTFEAKLKELTGKTSVRFVDQYIQLDGEVYTLSVDNRSKTATFTNGAEKKEIISGQVDTTTFSNYVVTNNRGKVSVSTKGTQVVPVLDFSNVTVDTFEMVEKYTPEQITQIEAAIEAYNNARANAKARTFIMNEDVTTLKQYEASLNQQLKLETTAAANRVKQALATYDNIQLSLVDGQIVTTLPTNIAAHQQVLDEYETEAIIKINKDIVLKTRTLKKGETIYLSELLSIIDGTNTPKHQKAGSQTTANMAVSSLTQHIDGDDKTIDVTIQAALLKDGKVTPYGNVLAVKTVTPTLMSIVAMNNGIEVKGNVTAQEVTLQMKQNEAVSQITATFNTPMQLPSGTEVVVTVEGNTYTYGTVALSPDRKVMTITPLGANGTAGVLGTATFQLKDAIQQVTEIQDIYGNLFKMPTMILNVTQ